jgi:hypothetical protein
MTQLQIAALARRHIIQEQRTHTQKKKLTQLQIAARVRRRIMQEQRTHLSYKK